MTLTNQQPTDFKSGFVNIIGNPNVGKSTLLNQILGEKLAIVSPKVQTTRHRIKGILNHQNYQIVFSDTPGVLNPKYQLQERMMDWIQESLQDADLILLLVDVNQKELNHKDLYNQLKKQSTPILILINKIDTATPQQLEQSVAYWHSEFANAEILPISALVGVNIDFLMNKILELMPTGPAYFDADQLTDKSERFVVSEVVREKILLNYDKEIPYATQVVVNQFKETKDLITIDTDIFVERESQKGIIIGHQGKSLQQVGKESRLELQTFFDKKIRLNLFVKVKKDWRKNQRDLDYFGY